MGFYLKAMYTHSPNKWDGGGGGKKIGGKEMKVKGMKLWRLITPLIC